MTNPFKGFFYIFSGLALIFRPDVRRYALWPIVINIVVVVSLVSFAFTQFDGWMEWMLSFLPGWLEWLRYILWPLLALSVLLVVFFSFSMIASLVAAPFNGPLSLAVERSLGVTHSTEGDSQTLVRSAMEAIGSELNKIAYFLIRAIPLWILLLVPFVNVVASVAWVIFSAWVLCIEFSDYPMANHGLAFKAQRKKLEQARFQSLGFGFGVNLLAMIPVLNFLLVPAAVAGASKMWVESQAGNKP